MRTIFIHHVSRDYLAKKESPTCSSEGRGRSPVHLAGDVDVIHEALDVERQVRGVGAHQLLKLLTLLVQAEHGPRVLLHVQLVATLEVLTEVVHQHLVKVAPAQVRVERGG